MTDIIGTGGRYCRSHDAYGCCAWSREENEIVQTYLEDFG